MMTIDAVQRRLALRVTFHAEAHVDFLHRHHPVHRLDRTVALLAREPGMDMRAMRELYEVRQGVHPVPSNLERGLIVIAPRAGDRLNSAGDSAAMASDASRDRRHARVLRAARILVAVLAGNLVDAGVNAMAERHRLDNVGARRPRAFRDGNSAGSKDKQDSRKRKKYPVHLGIKRSNCGRTRSPTNEPAQQSELSRLSTPEVCAHSVFSGKLGPNPDYGQPRADFQHRVLKMSKVTMVVNLERLMILASFTETRCSAIRLLGHR